MEKRRIQICGIPAVVWGAPARDVIVAVHGLMSHKEDRPLELLAAHAGRRGYQTISFDLPEHGERRDGPTRCKVQECIRELALVAAYARANWEKIGLFANSLGAYFSLMAYSRLPLQRVWFLAPLVDMRRMIESMMEWFQVPEERLRAEGEIPLPNGQTLYWDYYCYVKEHPVRTWEVPTEILCGERDSVCGLDTVQMFADRFGCRLETVSGAGHDFRAPEALQAYEAWLEKVL